MIFSSFEFIVFFTIVFTAMAVLQMKHWGAIIDQNVTRGAKHITLLVASYVFYGWWDWRFCILMFGLSIVAYISANKIAQNKNVLFYKIIGIVFPLIVLGIFKYFNFFIDSFAIAFGLNSLQGLNIILPVGISFFTFQTLSYVIDVARGKIESCKSFVKLALYIAFFPQLVAGPIVKASYFLPQLEEDRRITALWIEEGIQVFVFGLIKKIVIADTIAILLIKYLIFRKLFQQRLFC